MLPRHRQQLCHHKLHQRLIGPHSYAVTAQHADALQLQEVTYFTWPCDSQKWLSQKDLSCVPRAAWPSLQTRRSTASPRLRLQSGLD